jgi:hypothetical protein
MNRVFTAICICLACVGLRAADLSDDEVRAAIFAADKFKPLHLSEAFNMSASGFVIDVYSPAAWISELAKEAKREMRPFGFEDVTDDLRSDVWHVKVWPSTPRKMNQTALASSVSHVVARNESKSVVIQPLSKAPFDDGVQNAFGAQLHYTGLIAAFPGDGIRELWGPNEDQEFIFSVIGENWKYDFTIKRKHFTQLK